MGNLFDSLSSILNRRSVKKLFRAIEEADSKTVEKLLAKGLDPNAREDPEMEDSPTLLEVSSWKGHLGIMRLLMDHGADVNKGRYVGNPLIGAARAGQTGAVKLLLDAGANTERGAGGSRDTTLILAAQAGHAETVRALVVAGANVEAKNSNGDTALMWAALAGHPEVVRILIEAGSKLESKNRDGSTALIRATESALKATPGQAEALRILIEAGAEVDAKRRDGKTAMSLALERKDDAAFVEVLKQAGAEKQAPVKTTSADAEILHALEEGQTNPLKGLRILDALLSREPHVEAYNEYGQLNMKIGDLATARDAFERNIAASPDDDHRFDWAYLALIIGLQGDEATARECAGKACTIRIESDFASEVREAYIAWIKKHGRTPSRLSQAHRSDAGQNIFSFGSASPEAAAQDLTDEEGRSLESPAQRLFGAENEGHAGHPEFGAQDSPTISASELPTATSTDPGDAMARQKGDAATQVGEYRPGEILGQKYRILDVKRGGMGLVYIVEFLGSRESLALKTFQSRYLWDEKAISRFEREATNWVSLGHHPNIVYAFLVERVEATPYLWLEFVEGESLADRLKTTAPDVAETINIGLQFCEGMQFVHEKHGMLHRDVKPGNIMIRKDGVVKITDFGLSKLRAELAEQADRRDGIRIDPDTMQTSSNVFTTEYGVCVGTPAYIAPEAIRADSSLDIRADIYSFGIVLYEMLTARLPFTGPNILHQHLRETPHHPSAINPRIPGAMEDIVMRCLRKDPEHRFSSFTELAGQLEEAGRNLAGFQRAKVERISVPLKGQWFMKGYTLMELGKFEDAIRCFEKVLLEDPREAEAFNNIGVCLGNLKRNEEAAEKHKQAVELRPEYAEAWANLGGIYQQLGRYHEGIAACDRAIRQKPQWAESHANKGVCLLSLGKFQEGINCLNRAVQEDPNYWKAYAIAGQAFARAGDVQKAISSLEKALSINPREATILALQAACLADAGRMKEAFEYIERALQVNPRNELAQTVNELLAK